MTVNSVSGKSYSKEGILQHVDFILSGGLVVTMDDDMRLIPDGVVAVRDDLIVAVGERVEIEAAYRADEVIDCSGQYIMPGLVNAHTHVPMTLLRGLADDLRLDVWLMGYIMPTEREFVDPDFVRLGTKLACAEMIRGGTTTFTDMYYFEQDIAEATAEVGLRALLGETVLKFPAPDAETYEESLRYAREFIESWRGHPLITPAIAPHAPYSNTEETLKRCTLLAQEFDVPLVIHIAETQQEQDENVQQHGRTVLRWLKSLDVLKAKVLAAHCVAVNEAEIRQMQKNDVRVAHCPSANLKLASGIAPIDTLVKAGVVVGIGTDGPASNNDLDMFEEMRLAALIAKTAQSDPTAFPAKQALLSATRHGARAMYMDDITGSLERGKRADIIVVDANPIHNAPKFNLNPDAVYSQLVYAAKSSDVAHTIVNGVWLMRDRELLTVDTDALLQAAQTYAQRVDAFLSAREEDLLSKLAAVSGGLARGESFEVQVKAYLSESDAIEELLDHEQVEVVKSVHYRQFDTYFAFDDEERGLIRYREDDKLDSNDEVRSVRARLTFTEPSKERRFHEMIVLSRSRFIADADRPLRFYREYFQAPREYELQKDRMRWHVKYKDVLFYVNIDRVIKPNVDDKIFIELKSRTWSARDAEQKADMIREMLTILRLAPADVVEQDYMQMEGILERD
jgi:5-methylthioadenosine/S-adenosylhomocysteine deaminase